MPPARSPRRAKKSAAQSSTDRDLTRTYSRAQFVAKLRRFADAIESNRPFAIQVASERLRVPANVKFNIEHERTGTSQELEFQVLWTSDEADAAPARKRR